MKTTCTLAAALATVLGLHATTRSQAQTPAPDAGRLRIVVCLASGVSPEGIAEARAALAGCSMAVRAEVARSIHRKRGPEILFELRLAEEVDRG